MTTDVKTISAMNPNPSKPAGMPLASKIFIALMILAGALYFTYSKIHIPTNFTSVYKVAETPQTRILFNEKEVVVAKCRDMKNIGLYLESNITQDEYNGILMAVSTVPSTILTVKNQELTFKIKGVKLKVYDCQIDKGVLLGKIIKN